MVVDGQQRIRACLEFVDGQFSLNEKDSPDWADLTFEELSGDEKKAVFGYKFVVRTLPEMPEPELRGIFKRLNRNTVALNAQEMRHATYWGEFLDMVENEAESNDFWSDSGLFTPQAVRRMLDVEFISELAVACLHGIQHKKQKLDHFYQLYEEEFPDKRPLKKLFAAVTAEIQAVLPEIRKSRWSKRSDFYSLFVAVAGKFEHLPLSSDQRDSWREALEAFGSSVDEFLRADGDASDLQAPSVVQYSKAVGRAASDRVNRTIRHDILSEKLSV